MKRCSRGGGLADPSLVYLLSRSRFLHHLYDAADVSKETESAAVVLRRGGGCSFLNSAICNSNSTAQSSGEVLQQQD